ncbi:aquaporin [Streptomyces sp. NPDC060002]|uniref:aquaporin n=1 Tax=Streptomyces sp. NPDC060002 TaxID=3347033 RepID=UPI0036B430DC
MSNGDIFVGEVIGAAILILSGAGARAAVTNPARDLGPRIVRSFLPIPDKGTSDWGDAWIPVAGPLVGGALAGLLHHAAF